MLRPLAVTCGNTVLPFPGRRKHVSAYTVLLDIFLTSNHALTAPCRPHVSGDGYGRIPSQKKPTTPPTAQVLRPQIGLVRLDKTRPWPSALRTNIALSQTVPPESTHNALCHRTRHGSFLLPCAGRRRSTALLPPDRCPPLVPETQGGLGPRVGFKGDIYKKTLLENLVIPSLDLEKVGCPKFDNMMRLCHPSSLPQGGMLSFRAMDAQTQTFAIRCQLRDCGSRGPMDLLPLCVNIPSLVACNK